MNPPTAHSSDRQDYLHLLRLKQQRAAATSLREMAECCVEIEEVLGGRAPTATGAKEQPKPRGDD